MRVYFDNAATTPLSKEVVEEMTNVMVNHFGNPSSIHAEGRTMRSLIERARRKVATFLNASTAEIFFTSGGTESTNTALKCAVRDLGVRRIITSNIEHHCVSHTIQALQSRQHLKVDVIEVDKTGSIPLEVLQTKLSGDEDQKTLVSLMYANNEIGSVIPFDKIAQICNDHNALFHSDTVQAIGHFPIDLSKTQVHFITGAAHKFHGPKGVGFLYINSDLSIKPFIDGGGQERNMRGGTENCYGIVGMAKALEMACEEMEERKRSILSIRHYIKEKLTAHFADIQFNGQKGDSDLYTVLNVSFPPSEKGDMLLLNLDIAGISVSGGSACTSGAEVDSHVLRAIGHDPERKAIRFSFSHYNTKDEADFVIKILDRLIPEKKN